MPAPGHLSIAAGHQALGATVHGLKLGETLDRDTLAAVKQAWLDHLVLVFPDQPISDAEHVAFGEQLGRLEIHPSLAHRGSHHRAIYRVSNVDETGKLIPPKDSSWRYLSQSWRWHTDSSFREVPSKGSILHGIEITNEGGNTLFANLYAAYDALNAQTPAELEGRWVIHDHDYIVRFAAGPSGEKNEGTYDALPPVRHPLVRVHPTTGRKSLFLSPHTMTHIEGMGETESRSLLDSLIAHATAERFVYRHRWRPHDVVMWDNRCTMHAVEPFDNATIRRVMHRVTLVGEEAPIPA